MPLSSQQQTKPLTSSITYRNAVYQGGIDSQTQQRSQFGILYIAKSHEFVCCQSWEHDQVSGLSLFITEDRAYTYGNWRRNVPHGFNVFRSDDSVFMGYFSNGSILRGEKVVICYEKYSLCLILTVTSNINSLQRAEFELYEKLNIFSSNDLHEVFDKCGWPQDIFSEYETMIRYISAKMIPTKINNQSTNPVKLRLIKQKYFRFGYDQGLAVIFDQNYSRKSIGYHLKSEITSFGVAYTHGDEGEYTEQGLFHRNQHQNHVYSFPKTQADKLKKRVAKLYSTNLLMGINFCNKFYKNPSKHYQFLVKNIMNGGNIKEMMQGSITMRRLLNAQSLSLPVEQETLKLSKIDVANSHSKIEEFQSGVLNASNHHIGSLKTKNQILNDRNRLQVIKKQVYNSLKKRNHTNGSVKSYYQQNRLSKYRENENNENDENFESSRPNSREFGKDGSTIMFPTKDDIEIIKSQRQPIHYQNHKKVDRKKKHTTPKQKQKSKSKLKQKPKPKPKQVQKIVDDDVDDDCKLKDVNQRVFHTPQKIRSRSKSRSKSKRRIFIQSDRNLQILKDFTPQHSRNQNTPFRAKMRNRIFQDSSSSLNNYNIPNLSHNKKLKQINSSSNLRFLQEPASPQDIQRHIRKSRQKSRARSKTINPTSSPNPNNESVVKRRRLSKISQNYNGLISSQESIQDQSQESIGGIKKKKRSSKQTYPINNNQSSFQAIQPNIQANIPNQSYIPHNNNKTQRQQQQRQQQQQQQRQRQYIPITVDNNNNNDFIKRTRKQSILKSKVYLDQNSNALRDNVVGVDYQNEPQLYQYNNNQSDVQRRQQIISTNSKLTAGQRLGKQRSRKNTLNEQAEQILINDQGQQYQQQLSQSKISKLNKKLQEKQNQTSQKKGLNHKHSNQVYLKNNTGHGSSQGIMFYEYDSKGQPYQLNHGRQASSPRRMMSKSRYDRLQYRQGTYFQSGEYQQHYNNSSYKMRLTGASPSPSAHSPSRLNRYSSPISGEVEVNLKKNIPTYSERYQERKQQAFQKNININNRSPLKQPAPYTASLSTKGYSNMAYPKDKQQDTTVGNHRYQDRCNMHLKRSSRRYDYSHLQGSPQKAPYNESLSFARNNLNSHFF